MSPSGLRAVFLADLHMAAGPLDPFRADAELTRTLDALAQHAAGASQPPDLVLLGDILDFTLVEVRGRRIDMSADGALARLERIHAAHPTVFDALGRVAASGAAIHVVPGNHDLELLHDPVADAFGALSHSRPTVHPWAFHARGLVHAQHGQQHHDINRVRGLEAVATGAAPALEPPSGTLYGEYLLTAAGRLGAAASPATRAGDLLAHVRRRPLGAAAALPATLRFAGAAVARLARMQANRTPRARARERAAAAACAPALGIAPSAAGALADIGAPSPFGMVGRLARGRRSAAEPYMVAAARDVLETLAQHDEAVPFCVLAHTHAADDRPLGGGRRYLNPGTWSALAAPAAARFRCVEIGVDESGPWARLVPPLPPA